MRETYVCANCGRTIMFMPDSHGGRYEHIGNWEESCGLRAEPKR
jgi:hypothetical protein